MTKLLKKKSFRSILDVLKSSGYVDFQTIADEVKELRLTQLGGLLSENIKHAWLAADHSYSIFRYKANNSVAGDHHRFSFLGPHFQQNFAYIKQNFQKGLPLVVLEEEKNEAGSPYIQQASSVAGEAFFSGNTVSQLYFINPTMANQFYFKVQRQRKIWWMRYASNPGGLEISDTKDDDSCVNEDLEKVQVTNLNYKFGFGSVPAETVSLVTLSPTINDILKLRDSETGRKTTPAIIKSTMSTDMASLLLLIDGVDSSNDHILRINRKLAPFQIFLYWSTAEESAAKELLDLSQYVATILRKSNIRTFNPPKFGFSCDKAMQKEIIVADKLGVPYIIILDDASLKSGLMKLRNRETRISETIHLADVPDYLLKVFSAVS